MAGSLLIPFIGAGIANPAGASAKSAKCVTGNGQTVTNPLTCKGLAYYKGKTVTLYANGAVGAAADLVFRAIAPGVAAYLGATVNVGDAISGAGIAGTNTAADSPPNGLEVGWASINQDVADQAEKVPGVNFPLSKIEVVGASKGTIGILVSSASSGIKTIQQFLTTTTPVSVLQIAASSFEPLVLMLIAAYHVVPAKIVTGYSNSANLTQGFVRGDGPITGTSISTLGPLVVAGTAVPLLADKQVVPGDVDYQLLKNVPYPGSLLKNDPPKTKAGLAVMKALVNFESSSITAFILPRHTPVAYQTAMTAAFTSAFANPATEALISADGTPPGLIPAAKAVKIIANGISAEKVLAKFLP